VFNKQKEAKAAMKTLIESCLSKATYVLISYNNEGIITNDEWTELLANYRVKKYELDYNTFKGSRNLQSRNNKVIERMFLVSIM
jgi:adenine-specific DNA-methyltransferase